MLAYQLLAPVRLSHTNGELYLYRDVRLGRMDKGQIALSNDIDEALLCQ